MNKQELYTSILNNHDVKRVLPDVTMYRQGAIIMAVWNDGTIETWGGVAFNLVSVDDAKINFDSMCARWAS